MSRQNIPLKALFVLAAVSIASPSYAVGFQNPSREDLEMLALEMEYETNLCVQGGGISDMFEGHASTYVQEAAEGDIYEQCSAAIDNAVQTTIDSFFDNIINDYDLLVPFRENFLNSARERHGEEEFLRLTVPVAVMK